MLSEKLLLVGYRMWGKSGLRKSMRACICLTSLNPVLRLSVSLLFLMVSKVNTFLDNDLISARDTDTFFMVLNKSAAALRLVGV